MSPFLKEHEYNTESVKRTQPQKAQAVSYEWEEEEEKSHYQDQDRDREGRSRTREIRELQSRYPARIDRVPQTE